MKQHLQGSKDINSEKKRNRRRKKVLERELAKTGEKDSGGRRKTIGAENLPKGRSDQGFLRLVATNSYRTRTKRGKPRGF